MRYLLSLFICWLALGSATGQTPLPHGMVYGTKPDTSNVVPASRIEAFMANKARVSTTIKGKVIKVTRQKGGWFEIEAGKGKVITAQFKNYNVSLPLGLKGKTVMVQGVAKKQFIADDGQHFAGDTARGKRQHAVNTNPKRRLLFEVSGLMIYQ
jgi:hypothetical protein